jgi:hypothetical protein
MKIAPLALLLPLLAACASSPKAPPPAAPETTSCALDANGPALDVAGHADGIYGVIDNKLEPTPLARFETMRLEESGAEPDSGKRWLHIQVGDADAPGLRSFTAGAPPRDIAVIVDGHLAARHRVKTALTSAQLQVSCCDPRACDAWEKRLTAH